MPPRDTSPTIASRQSARSSDSDTRRIREDLELERRLSHFSDWAEKHVTGDEKGESQIFLDRLFQAFGHAGLREAGATLEMRVKKETAHGTAFADLVWKPIVLIEMKKRNEDLRKHYRQAFDYWTRLVPGRPRYVVLSNFDEFWVFDFETQMDRPVGTVRLADLSKNYGALAFLSAAPQKPIFDNDGEAVTRAAADRLAACFTSIYNRGYDRGLAQRFVLQMLVALFAEDIGLLEKYFVSRLLDECNDPQKSYDLIGGLFQEMNTPGKTPGGRYKGVDYFNGGVFADPARIELLPDEVSLLRAAAASDWSMVSPEIFGTLFEHSLDEDKRHSLGAHFTSPVDIMKIVGPTIVVPWTDLIENATSGAELRRLLTRLSHYKVLDPACGSGNFLYLAYREVKRLEARLYERLTATSKRRDPLQREFGFVTAANFFGIDINPFAVELAKVSMMIGRKLAIDELHVTENALPLDNLDNNFVVADALLGEDGNKRTWPKADVIIGNPPFLGAKLLKPDKGDQYVKALRKAYPEVPGMADYCVYWFRQAHDQLAPCTSNDPVTGRAGLVGTQNIRNNKSRVGGLDYITSSGTIVEAVDNQPWSGEANVHVSIVNWVKSTDPQVIPVRRRFWKKASPGVTRTKNKRLASREYELVYEDVQSINSALSDTADLSKAVALPVNTRQQFSFQGVVPGYPGFVISLEQRERLIALDQRNEEVVKPYLIGRDMLSGNGEPSRAILDFADMDRFTAESFSSAFSIVQESVLPSVQETAKKSEKTDMSAARKQHLDRWWQFWNVRSGMRAAISKLPRYMACSRVTKRPIFCFIDPAIIPDCALQVFTLSDDYSFGVLQSDVHWQWFIAKCSKLKSDFRYTPHSVFDTFPWPQTPSEEDVKAIAEAAASVRLERDSALSKVKGGLRAVYQSLELPGKDSLRAAHAELNAAVVRAYGFSASASFTEQLLQLNEALQHSDDPVHSVIGPGVPQQYANLDGLQTRDMVTLSELTSLTRST